MEVNEQLIERMLDDTSQAMSFSDNPRKLKHKEGIIDMGTVSYEGVLTDAQGIVAKINERLRQL